VALDPQLVIAVCGSTAELSLLEGVIVSAGAIRTDVHPCTTLCVPVAEPSPAVRRSGGTTTKPRTAPTHQTQIPATGRVAFVRGW